MSQFQLLNDILSIQLDVSELTPQQVRLIKSLNAMLVHTLQTDDEEEFFDGSAELMRICASLIKQARFSEKRPEDIAYEEQALEYSVDAICEDMNSSKLVALDN